MQNFSALLSMYMCAEIEWSEQLNRINKLLATRKAVVLKVILINTVRFGYCRLSQGYCVYLYGVVDVFFALFVPIVSDTCVDYAIFSLTLSSIETSSFHCLVLVLFTGRYFFAPGQPLSCSAPCVDVAAVIMFHKHNSRRWWWQKGLWHANGASKRMFGTSFWSLTQ